MSIYVYFPLKGNVKHQRHSLCRFLLVLPEKQTVFNKTFYVTILGMESNIVGLTSVNKIRIYILEVHMYDKDNNNHAHVTITVLSTRFRSCA